MATFRTWMDQIREAVQPQELPGVERLASAVVIAEPTLNEAGEDLSAPVTVYVDRSKGEGPPACCGIRRVAADALVWYGGLPAAVLERVRAALPRVAEIPAEELYLCDGCRGLLKRHQVLAPGEMPRSRPPAGMREKVSE